MAKASQVIALALLAALLLNVVVASTLEDPSADSTAVAIGGSHEVARRLLTFKGDKEHNKHNMNKHNKEKGEKRKEFKRKERKEKNKVRKQKEPKQKFKKEKVKRAHPAKMKPQKEKSPKHANKPVFIFDKIDKQGKKP